ncbi:hypothetical protein DCAR_0521903 [Daucus carota subsp. sativus]|uniref:Transcription factor CBF/NF-Y/archaeal histone domain-containing protein n=1 Tax=Daucus carota subsp. sativus TaxID=79200 RepID=A0A164ZGL9_DAUCS|nr:hypothetical protein DCAR_0521903 [Daucus carota subsp. sativus]
MADGSSSQAGGSSESREHDRIFPIANISRIMKKGMPANGKISKDAKDTVEECVSEASEKCQKEKRKTIDGDDLLGAMANLGFEDYVGPLKNYLSCYRESMFLYWLTFYHHEFSLTPCISSYVLVWFMVGEIANRWRVILRDLLGEGRDQLRRIRTLDLISLQISSMLKAWAT